MTVLTAATDRMHQARGLPAVLDAACDGFETILAVVDDYEDTHDDLVVSFLLAATQAANGRDALLFAPSLPPRSSHPQPGEGQQPHSAADISGAVARLSLLLATQLANTAASATLGADRGACHDAARHARQIHHLLAGGGP
jgi:hypothetical protein